MLALAAVLALALAGHTPTTFDLAPFFGDAGATGPGADGLSLYEAGRLAEAAAVLARAEGPHAAYVRARVLEESGRHAEAARQLAGLEGDLPEISDRIAFLRGEALAAAGRPADAVASWEAVPAGSVLRDRARLAVARTAAELGDRARALRALAPLVGRPPPEDRARPDDAAAALLLSGRLRARGPGADPAGARADLLACWSSHPVAPDAPACLSALLALPAPHSAAPPPELSLTRAEGLLEANRAQAALALLRRIPAGPASADDAFACRVQAATGRAWRRLREHGQALATLRPVAERCTDPALLPRVLFVLAGSEAVAGSRDGAVARYRDMAARFPSHPLADDALLAAADLLASDGRIAEARAALADLVRSHPDGDVRDEARFRSAWLARRAGDVDAAVATLAEIESAEAEVDPYEHARAAYWRASLLAARGELDPGSAAQARAIWAEVVARYPADYYGLLARARLAGGDRLGALPAPFQPGNVIEPSWSPGPLLGDPHALAGVLLVRLGLDEDAAEELRAVDQAALATAGPEPLLVLADLLDRAGDHRSASQLLRTRARGALPRAPRSEDLRAWRIAYPPAYRDVVKRWAPTAGVPTDLVQAVMREESALDPKALSTAGAIGLTQLMLPTARQLARQAGVPLPSRRDLMKAEVNVRLGARYLGQLLRRFDGSLVMALAAYNAGPTPVVRWREERGGDDPDAFVEEIPFDETRAYVKRVLRSYAAYHLLYGSSDEPATALGTSRARG